MTLKTLSIHGSPYIGIFCSVTDEIGLIPSFVEKKEQKKLEETLSIETIHTSLADSHLLGVLSRGYGKKFAVACTSTRDELDALHHAGIRTHVVEDITAIGNLLCLQKHGGIVSPLVKPREIQKLEAFLGIPLHPKLVAKSELAGSCVAATEKGFLAHPRTEPHEMESLENVFKIPGMTTTANYGDAFIGNSVLVNKHGGIVGERTSGPELARIDEGLNPGLIQQ